MAKPPGPFIAAGATRLETLGDMDDNARESVAKEDSLADEVSEDLREAGNDRGERQPGAIRAEDIEPYFALQYVARLFKIAALVVIVALTAEVVAGIFLEGAGAILPLFAEVIRGVVLAAILWGVGDLTVLFIDVGHDVRAARVLLGRVSARLASEQAAPPDVAPGFQEESPGA